MTLVNDKLQQANTVFSNKAAAPGLETIPFLERVLNYLAIAVIGFAFLTMQTLYVNIMLGPTWGGRLDKSLTLLLWGLMVVLVILRFLRGDRRGLMMLYLLLTFLCIDIILLIVRDGVSFNGILYNWFIRIFLAFIISFLVARNRHNRALLAWLVVVLSLINLVFAVWNPEPLIFARRELLTFGIFGSINPGNVVEASAVTSFNAAITGSGLAGLFYNRTGFAVLLSAAACLVFALNQFQAVSRLIFLVLLGGLILSKSRGPLLALPISLALFLWSQNQLTFKSFLNYAWNQRGRIWAWLTVIILVTNIEVWTQGSNFEKMLRQVTDSGAMNRLEIGALTNSLSPNDDTMIGQLMGRFPGLSLGLELIIQNPLIGLSDWDLHQTFYMKMDQFTTNAHNFIIDLLVRKGILYGFVMIVLMVYAMRRLFTRSRQQNPNGLSLLDAAWLATLVGIQISGLTHSLYDLWIFWIAFGVGLAIDSSVSEMRSPKPLPAGSPSGEGV